MASLAHDETDYPEFWDWSKDGIAEGTFVRMDSGPTAFGMKPIMILDIDGIERSIWINTEALRSKLADELARRNVRDFTPGERVKISRGNEKKTSAAERLYWPFRVWFPDAPKSDAADLLGLGSDSEPLPPVTGEDDDIPFD
jgi:hypothetical protein